MSDENFTPGECIGVNNGHRVPVKLANFEGLAGFVQQKATRAQLAYFPTVRGVHVEVDTIIPVMGVDWRVTKVEQSPYVERMALLTLES